MRVVLPAVLLLLAACGPTAAPPVCDSTTCATGCCRDSVCVQAASQGGPDGFCGTLGATCAVCAASQACVSGACIEPGTGGGAAMGGGTASGGGSATGGGTAAGGGSATGGGSAAGGGSATGGASGCTPLTIPASALLQSFYSLGATGEATYSTRQWRESNGRHLLSLQAEWSIATGSPVPFPVTSKVVQGLTDSWVVMFYWRGCSEDLTTCAKKFVIWDGTVTLDAATRGPSGSLTGRSAAPLSLQELSATGFASPGECVSIPALDWSSTYQCGADGASCTRPSQCCANVCQAGRCGLPPPCKADGLSCSAASECCTGQCSSGQCGAPVCKADGLSCSSASQCCTGQCSSGQCGAPVCKADGLSCSAASQCCTGQCSSGQCGAPVCKANGLSCSSASQCCTAQCSSGQCGPPVCKPDGLSCSAASQCCTGQCSSGQCGAPVCKADGLSCSAASQCCTGQCTNGQCGAATCRSNGDFCTAGSQCCAGACTNNACGLTTTACNPVTNTGCGIDDCLLLSSGVTTCAQGGFGTQGSSCSATNLCAGGYACFGGSCRKICNRSSGAGCSGGSVCNPVTGWTTYGACN